ncbi:MAG: pirin family protein [Bacteroidetes bacterium]|nr:MAG: pirin family protein [Bacteroidota bacterium]
MTIKKIKTLRKAPTSRGMGPNVKQVIPSAVENLDPFVFLDHFSAVKQPRSGGIPPHPHAGIATITYLFEGSNRHRDSLGNDKMVQAGDIAWMQAGKGIIHSEGMQENRTEPENVHGLQLWISLPAKDKFIKPDFFFYPSQDLPTITTEEGVSIKVLCGEVLGQKSPVKSLSPAYIFEVKMPAQTTLRLPVQVGDTCGVYGIAGKIGVDKHEITAQVIAEMDKENDTLVLQAETESHCVILGGTPLNEPIVAYASYVMNDQTQIMQAMRDYQMGKMGFLEY